ncbi:MAG: glucose-1-phosphate adenylyltransferase [Elusimicrobia bacterium]|jgi:glucose-1-phosphate adenylyltransferase|nr:glucose-1-phosphate adenylyltransferase [Elusimicrobiota bacterium]
MKTIGIIMAGGKGERLYPLTKERSKPAVPFAGKYRIIDFVLSNFINSGIYANYVLVQYLSQSLIEHIRQNWSFSSLTNDQFITVVPPQMRLGEMWYRGTADAVKQNLNLITDFSPDLVAIFGADHIYRMDIGQMIKFHMQKKADVTISAITVPIKEASRFGTIMADEKDRVCGFEEKPKNPKPMPSNPDLAYASMGNYIFNFDVLREIMHEFSDRSDVDFGKTILPAIYKDYGVFAYNYSKQVLPGIKDYEESNYWRDVGTIQSYFDAHMDFLGQKPLIDLNNSRWPIISQKFISGPARIIQSNIEDSLVSDGSVIVKSSLKKCVISSNVIIHDKCELTNCIIMDSCEIHSGSRLKNVIVDRFNIFEPKTVVGFNPDRDAQNYYIDPSGIVIIPRGISKWE